MSDPETPVVSETKQETAVVTGAGAVAGAQATIDFRPTIIIQQPPVRRGAGGHSTASSRQPKVPSKPANGHVDVPGQRAPRSVDRVEEQGPDNWSERNYPHVEIDSLRGFDGNVVQVIKDDKHGSVSVTRDPSTGEFKLTFRDLDGVITTQSDKLGFQADRYHNHGYGGSEKEHISATPSWGGSEQYGLRGNVYCGRSDGYFTDGQVAASDHVVGSTTIDQLQQFLKKHPSLVAPLREGNVQLTEAGGQSYSADEIVAARPRFQACPTADTQVLDRGKNYRE